MRFGCRWVSKALIFFFFPLELYRSGSVGPVVVERLACSKNTTRWHGRSVVLNTWSSAAARVPDGRSNQVHWYGSARHCKALLILWKTWAVQDTRRILLHCGSYTTNAVDGTMIRSSYYASGAKPADIKIFQCTPLCCVIVQAFFAAAKYSRGQTNHR